MNKEKIAVLTDSGNDVLSGISENLFVVPLLIQVDNKTYIDGVNISLEETLKLIDNHKVTTSLPSSDVIIKTLDDIKEEGYTHVIINTISSGLSGTYNIVRLLIEDYEGLEIELVDTKNISKGSGYTTNLALELIEQGLSFKEIVETLKTSLKNHKVFFTVGTVDYLRRGGRIGLVAGAVANILSIKPVITCNENGVYHSVSKTRGYPKAISKMIDLAVDFKGDSKIYDITILTAEVDERTKEAIELIKETFSDVRNLEIKPVTPALGIHTGPQAIGIAVSKIG